jgi:hypothetical protein
MLTAGKHGTHAEGMKKLSLAAAALATSLALTGCSFQQGPAAGFAG